MKVLNQKKLPFPIFQGTPEETRDLAITTIINHINQSSPPPEAFKALEQLINQKFLNSPVEAIHEDLKTLDSRIRHLEASLKVRETTAKYAFQR